MIHQSLSAPAVRLTAIDWNFAGSDKSDSIHSIHPYPGKFIPEIPRTLILQLRPPVDYPIFDPFCGSGTTLVEAQRLGYSSIGVDLNPIACLIARVKTSALPPSFLPVAYDCAYAAARTENFEVPDIPNVEHWFSAEARLALAKLVTSFRACADSAVLDHIRLALSSIIVRVSNQESDTRYAAIPKKIDEQEIYRAFKAACVRLAKLKPAGQHGHAPSDVIEANVLSPDQLRINGQVGMVITSPPYPNAYEYWLYHKYRMWWLGHDPIDVKRQEIGARAHYFRRNPATVDDFRKQMQTVVSFCREKLVPGGYACFLIGRSIIHGREIDNAAIVFEAALEAGFSPITRIERTIAQSRKSFNLAHARIKKEELLVFANG